MSNIAFDLDGVLYPWHEAVYSYLNSMSKEEMPSFDAVWKNPYGYMKKEKWDFIATLPFLYETIIPKKGILEMITTLDSEGHTIYYITNRPEDSERVTRKYLADYNFPQNSNLILTKDKEHIVRSLEIDVIVEDRPENMEKLVGICRTIGVVRPWNEEKIPYLESLGVIFIPTAECAGEVI